MYSFLHNAKKLLNSNDVEGLYLTFADFKHGKLTRPTDKQHKGDKIKLKQFFISPKIISIEQQSETKFNKDSIFAIRLSNGEKAIALSAERPILLPILLAYIFTLIKPQSQFIVHQGHTAGQRKFQ